MGRRGLNLGTSTRTYKVFALCSATSDAIVEATDSFTLFNGESGGAAATCSSGRRVVSGGIGWTSRFPDNWPRVQVSGPLDETGSTANTGDGDIARFWYANACGAHDPFAVGTFMSIRVFALCSATSDAIVEATPLNPGPDGSAGSAATCPARIAVGGGVGTTSDVVNSVVQLSGPLDETGTTQNTVDGDRAYSWYANVRNVGPSRDYKVFALCASSETAPARTKPPADFDGDRDTDVSVFRPSNGYWFVHGGATTQFGTNGDIPVPGDFDGNGTTDIAVFRPSNGYWFVHGGATTQFGTNGDIPVPGDYDGDGTTDIAVYRPSNGYWFVRNGTIAQFGTNGDIPVPGDYDGDGDTDIAVFRPSNGYWFVHGGPITQFGASGDVPVPGDYNSDGRTDIAVFRPSNGYWFVHGGSITQFGASADIPLPLPHAIRRLFFS